MGRPAANPRVSFQTMFVDEDMLVVAKPRGVVTQPGRGNTRNTLLNGVFARWGAALTRLGERRDFGLVHRLDRATSGLVVFGLTPEGYDGLRAAFAERVVEKRYLTVVRGRPPRSRGEARIRLLAVRRGDLRVSVCDPSGEEAVTRWRQVAWGSGRALLECVIETGRLHQIRAHLAALGCPVEGDTVYGRGSDPDHRASTARRADAAMLLHAWRLGIDHPRKGHRLRFESPLPEYFERALAGWGIQKIPTGWGNDGSGHGE